MTLKITIGADPEVFLRNSKGELQSAHGWHPNLTGTKNQPQFIKDYNGAIQVDGNALEFNIYPAASAKDFCSSIQYMLTYCNNVAQWNRGSVVIEPVAIFDPRYFDTLPAECKELGCDPDFNAYTGEQNPRPKNLDKPTLRTAAGHIHIGWTESVDIRDPNHRQDAFDVAKQLDFYLGLYTLLWDKDQTRRTLYGKAGACRVKPYGMEYRTPSNAWLRNHRLVEFVYESAMKAVTDLANKKSAVESFGNWAQQTINAGNAAWGLTKIGMQIREFTGLPLPNGCSWGEEVKAAKKIIGEIPPKPHPDAVWSGGQYWILDGIRGYRTYADWIAQQPRTAA